LIERRDKEIIQRKGKFALWLVELVDGAVVTGFSYEIRKGDRSVSECSDEKEAIREMNLQDALELQNRPTGSGM
jgi:hypothetical protein